MWCSIGIEKASVLPEPWIMSANNNIGGYDIYMYHNVGFWAKKSRRA